MESLKTLCTSWCGLRVKLPSLGFTSSESRSCWSRRVRSIDWQVKIQGGQSHSYTSGRLRRLSRPPVVSPCETVAQMWPQLLLLFSCPDGSNSFVPPWTAARQAPLSMGFSRQEYWSGLPCPPPGDLPNPGIVPMSLKSPALASRFFTVWATREARVAPEPLAGGTRRHPWLGLLQLSPANHTTRAGCAQRLQRPSYRTPAASQDAGPTNRGAPTPLWPRQGHAASSERRHASSLAAARVAQPGNPASVLSLFPSLLPFLPLPFCKVVHTAWWKRNNS